MRTSIQILIALFLASFIFSGCIKGIVDPYYSKFTFSGDYTNPAGAGTFKIEPASLPRQIQIPSNQMNISATNCQVNRKCMTITNVRLKDELGIYNIEKASDVITEEMRSDGTWDQDVENKLTITKTQNLEIVLVLDYSSSLGDDITSVRNYAKTFIDYIEKNNPGSRVGIVTFSSTVQTLALTTNYATARSFIQSQMAGADETRLYEAMDKGITLFQNSTAEGKAMVTFTDGKNNSWSTPAFQTYEFLQNKLKTPVGSTPLLLSSYTIGLNGKQGGVDPTALNALALNGGISAVAPDALQLEKIFQRFASSVSAVYTMTYNRNSSLTSNVKLRFVLHSTLQ